MGQIKRRKYKVKVTIISGKWCYNVNKGVNFTNFVRGALLLIFIIWNLEKSTKEILLL